MRQIPNNKAGNDQVMNPDFAGTDASKVKQQIQKDVKAGIGAITSREAGAMNGKKIL